MKLSQFRGKDRKKIMLFYLIVIIVIVIVVLVAFFRLRPMVQEKLALRQEEAAEKNQTAANEVDALISQIGEVTADSASAIEAAREGYDALNAKQKELVTLLDVLTNAEDTYAQLVQSDSDEAAAQEAAAQEEAQVQENLTAIHRYEYIVEDCTWSEAVQRCLERGGYLVNINSEEEFNYIIGEIEANGVGDKIFYLGARRDNESDYYWMNASGELYGDVLNGNSEVWSYSYWMQGEPSFYDGDVAEDKMTLFYYSGESRYVLNDGPDDVLAVVSYYSGKIGYICEYED